MLRDKDVFGVDADMFRPERWLREDGKVLAVMEATLDLCFGVGRWGCLGRGIAEIELNKAVFEVSAVTWARCVVGVMGNSDLN